MSANIIKAFPDSYLSFAFDFWPSFDKNKTTRQWLLIIMHLHVQAFNSNNEKKKNKE